MAAANNIIATELNRTLQLVEIYRKVKRTKNIEASVRMAYNSKEAMEIAKKALSKRLEEETNLTRERLEKLLDFGSGGE